MAKVEVWKPIAGFEGLYEVSNLGQVKSLERLRITKGGGITKVCERILKQTLNKFGYCKVTLTKAGKHHFFVAHRLVAMAFIPNPEIKPEINHKDGNKQNNCVDNLEWCTPTENKRHAYATGLNGGEHIKTRKRVNQYDMNFNLIATYPSIAEAERATKTKNIWMCCNFKCKAAGGYIWRYA